MTAWDNNFWLDLNYLDIARAAHNCAAHFSAAFMAEVIVLSIYDLCYVEPGDMGGGGM